MASRPIGRICDPLLLSDRSTPPAGRMSPMRSERVSFRRKPLSRVKRIAAIATGLPLPSAIARPSSRTSSSVKRRVRRLPASLRAPRAGLELMIPARRACSKIAPIIPKVRAATPLPPVVRPPRAFPLARCRLTFPMAMSACIASSSVVRNADTGLWPISGLTCASIRLRSISIVLALICWPCRPSRRPVLASVRYQSITSPTVTPVWRARLLSPTGSPPPAARPSNCRARARASSGVRVP